MGSLWSYVVTHYDKSLGPWTSQDITPATDTIPVATDVSGGEINTAVIEINGNLGHYIRAQRGGESGFPTIIEHNDRIRIILDDGVTSPAYNQVFEVIRKIPIKTESGGTKLRLQCEGLERHLMKMKYIKPFYFATPKEALIDLVNYYNVNRTSSMPELLIGVNELPDQGIHKFDW